MEPTFVFISQLVSQVQQAISRAADVVLLAVTNVGYGRGRRRRTPLLNTLPTGFCRGPSDYIWIRKPAR